MHSWQNGTTCRDGVQVLWWHSHLVWATELSYLVTGLVDWTGGLTLKIILRFLTKPIVM